MGTLDGLLVVSLEQAVAAPFVSSRLADAGARVIKIERPEGDFARNYGDVVKGEIFRLYPKNSAKSYRKIDETICHDIQENLPTRFNMDLKVYVKS